MLECVAGGLRATNEGMICHNARLVSCVIVFQTWYTSGSRKIPGTHALLYCQAPNTKNLLSVSSYKLASVVCTLFAVAMTILHVDCRSSDNPNLLLVGQWTRDGKESVGGAFAEITKYV